MYRGGFRMASLTDEGLAGIRLLVCMAKADGILKPEERVVLEDALAEVALPNGLTVAKLLDENNDPQELAAQITSREARDYTYASVYSLAYCDRELAGAEASLLALLRAEWGLKADEDQALQSALDRSHDASAAATAAPVVAKDAGAREGAFHKLLNRYAVLTSLTGAIPVPLVPDLMVVPMQVKMVHDIAALFGHTTDKATVQLMFETLGVGTGARLGISALCKLVPGWGSVVGAASSFATTYALAKVAWTFYASEGLESFESLKPLFETEQKQGKVEFKKHQAALEEAQRTHADTLKQLAYELHRGAITQQEYEKRIDALA